MTKTWETFTQAQRDLAQDVFASICSLDMIDAAIRDRKQGERRAGFGDLYAYVTDPDRPMGKEVREAVEASPKLRQDLNRLLESVATYWSPRLAAAGTGPITNREGQGFAIRLRPSRAEPAQVYVVIDLNDLSLGMPKTLFVSERQHRLLKQQLPEAHGSTIQLLAEANSDLVRALKDPGSEVFLR